AVLGPGCPSTLTAVHYRGGPPDRTTGTRLATARADVVARAPADRRPLGIRDSSGRHAAPDSVRTGVRPLRPAARPRATAHHGPQCHRTHHRGRGDRVPALRGGPRDTGRELRPVV